MKVNNPNKKCFKLGEYNGLSIFFHPIQDSTYITKGMKSDGPSFYITGLYNMGKIIEQIKTYESK
jgi:hypothetical protein